MKLISNVLVKIITCILVKIITCILVLLLITKKWYFYIKKGNLLYDLNSLPKKINLLRNIEPVSDGTEFIEPVSDGTEFIAEHLNNFIENNETQTHTKIIT